MTARRPTGSAAYRALAAAAGTILLSVSGHSPFAHAQETADTSPAFEVTSIKPNDANDGRVMLNLQPGRFRAVNVTTRLLIRQAYRVQDFQIVEGPDWITADTFDVLATLPPEDATGQPSPERVGLMLQQMLADRFGLVLHRETRELPIYALVRARDDGTPGPGLTPTQVDCEAARGRRGGGPPPPLPQPGQRIDCGMMMGPGTINAGGMGTAELARTLSQFTGRVVLDDTGLDGRYDFELRYAPEPGAFAGGPAPPPGADAVGLAIDPNLPALPTALVEQLGLRLDARRGPVEVLVVDRVERPEPN